MPFGLWVPAGLLVLSAALVHRAHVGGQLLARAVLWANLLLGSLIATSSGNHERPLGALLALSTGVALLALGRDGVEAGDGAQGVFAPKAWRGSLMLAMVLGLADAQSLLLFGTIDKYDDSALKIACAAFVSLGVVGLYRLRVWGVLVSLLANLGVAVLALSDLLEVPRPVKVALVITAAVQLLLPTPIVLAMFKGGRASEGRLPRAGWAAATATVVALMVLAGLCTAFQLKLWEP